MMHLVIAPHPDDEILGCGGVIARHQSLGEEVSVLVVSRGISELFESELIETTRQELRAAHEILKISQTQFLDFPAPRLDTIPRHELADAIGKVIREVQPNIVYLPHHGDLHIDHQAVFRAAMVACRPINNCSVRRVLSYETLSETEWGAPFASEAFVPNVFVDITPYLSRKLEAMASYRSQLKSPPHSRSLQAVEAQARLRGSTISVSAAEAFMLIRDIVD